MRTQCRIGLAVLSLVALVARPVAAQTATTAGEFSVEPPTLVSLGFDWKITGDDNRNAQVELTYRKKGDTAVEARPAAAAPAARVGKRRASAGRPTTHLMPRFPFDYVVPNMFSGSVLNLEPDTEYECRLVLSDPDGVRGEATKTVTVRTRREPQPATGGKTYHVYPVGWTGPKQEPAFTGLMSAYYMGTAHYDYQNAYPPRVKPGDVILVHAGLYVSDRFHYMNGAARPGYLSLGTVFDGTYYLTASGTADRPIVIKGAGDGEVIFDGDGAQNLFNLMAANYNYFEGLTIRNTNVAFLAGIKDIAGSSGFTLKHSRIYNVGRAVQDDWSGSKNYYIADNVVHRPPRSRQDDELDRRDLGEVPGLPRAPHVRVRHQGLRTGSRRGVQLPRALARLRSTSRRMETPTARPIRSPIACPSRSTSTATTSSTWATTASSRTAAPTTSACSGTGASTSASQAL